MTLAEQAGAQLVLLDIRMPGMDGIEAARHLAQFEQPPAVIFTTAYDSHAMDAIEANAVAYLLKPVRRERLQDAILRARTPTRAQLASLQASPVATASSRTHVSATLHGSLRLVPVEAVRFFRAEHKYVIARHPDGELVLEDSLTILEEEFQERFMRVHRNALVALAYIRGVERASDGKLAIALHGVDDRVEVSRRLAGQVRRAVREVGGR